MKQIPCRQAPRINPSFPFPKKDDGTLSLTEQGQSIAKQIYEKHRFFTKQLIKAGVPCDIAEADACRLEHVISETSFARLKEAATQEQK